ncbi:MAG: small, acid-soluble spore protein, alpha/beta type [Dethiobacteria bacterium]|nr:small, acid-soluble spore protein, alpha/beta type [Bacillota bacterium]
MPRRRPIMSDALKYEIAEELGVADIVYREGWGSVSSRNCGNIVKKAIERAEKALLQQRGQ